MNTDELRDKHQELSIELNKIEQEIEYLKDKRDKLYIAKGDKLEQIKQLEFQIRQSIIS